MLATSFYCSLIFLFLIGTLGIVTEVTLRVRPLPECQKYVASFCLNLVSSAYYVTLKFVE